jgi:hypothetical protein
MTQLANADRERYRVLCDQRSDIPLFQQAWWLDACCGHDGWDVALSFSDGQIAGALPYIAKRRVGFTILTQPSLTQFLGPWIAPATTKPGEQLGREKDIMGELLDQLPQYSYYSQGWSPTVTNWLPFYWAGFKQTLHYTYVISDLSDEQAIWANLQSNIRGYIRKAQKLSIRLQENPSLDAFIAVNDKTFARQGLATPYSSAYLRRVDQACAQRGQRRILLAEDAQGRVHAGAYLVWDQHKTYYLASGGDPDLRNSGAASYCLWQAIQFARTVSKSFDFEGSMMEPVERFFRGFGAQQVPYFRITRTPSRLLRLHTAMRSLMSK